MSANRIRKKQIIMRLTDGEHELLLKRMGDAGMINMSAYIRKMALTGYILRLDLSEVRETLRLVANSASNINQVTKVVNESRSIYAADMIRLQEEVGSMRKQVADVMKVFRKVHELHNLLKK